MRTKTDVSDLKDRTNRRKLPVRIKPYFVSLGNGRSIGYGRNKGVGAWVLRTTDGKGKPTFKRFAQADDFDEANGVSILTYRQALERVSADRGDDETSSTVSVAAHTVTVGDALDEYERDLDLRGGRTDQVDYVRRLLGALLKQPVALLKFRDLRRWRDAELGRGLKAGTVTRNCKTIKAALNFIAKQPDQAVKNKEAWTLGLESLPDSNIPRRGMVLSEERVNEIVDACRAHDAELGLFVEVLAVTGCRASQVARLIVSDLKKNGVTMPRSLKGKGKKRMSRAGFPLPQSLLDRLHDAAGGRDGDEPLLKHPNGSAWSTGTLRYPWRAALAAAGLPFVIPYALRHTSITLALKKGLSAETVAKSRDTSVRMLERVYGAELDQVSAPEILGSLISIG